MFFHIQAVFCFCFIKQKNKKIFYQMRAIYVNEVKWSHFLYYVSNMHDKKYSVFLEFVQPTHTCMSVFQKKKKKIIKFPFSFYPLVRVFLSYIKKKDQNETKQKKFLSWNLEALRCVCVGNVPGTYWYGLYCNDFSNSKVYRSTFISFFFTHTHIPNTVVFIYNRWIRQN